MKFRTEISIPPFDKRININDQLITIGSCFSTVIGEKLVENKFQVLSNHFGTTYNPYSIIKLFKYALGFEQTNPEDIIKVNDIYLHPDFHSRYASTESLDLILLLEKAIDEFKKTLKICDWIIITLGTAFVYRRLENNALVNNCHKQPSKYFNKEVLKIKDIIDDYQWLINNVDSNIILTVSPVRHLKDSLIENSYSKSVLRFVTRQIVEIAPQKVFYFPSFEIMMDDLRDYRYYKEDLIHPTAFAEDYIFQKFISTAIDNETIDFVSQWGDIKKALAHKPFNPGSDYHKQFILKTIKRLESLSKKVNVEAEIEKLKTSLK